MRCDQPLISTDRRQSQIAVLTALACVLQIAESLIPHPIPGLRLGLANMLTLTALVALGFGGALEVAVLRTVLSSFLLGTFMSPAFILSLGGAVAGTCAMGFFYWLSGLSCYSRLSIIGISIIGAFVHNMAQLCLAYLLLVKHSGVFALFPWLSISAVGTGWVVGAVAGGVCQRIRADVAGFAEDARRAGGAPLQYRFFTPGDSWLHRLPAKSKLTGLSVMALVLLGSNHALVPALSFLFLGLMPPLSRTPWSFCLRVVRRYSVLILFSFLLPVCFNSGAQVIVDFGLLRITGEGVLCGTLNAARIFLMVLAGALFMRTTRAVEIAAALGSLLRPLGLIGVSAPRIATLLCLAWTALPQVWETTRDAVAALNMKKIRNLRRLLPLLSDLIATLYLKADLGANTRTRQAWATHRDAAECSMQPGTTDPLGAFFGKEYGTVEENRSSADNLGKGGVGR